MIIDSVQDLLKRWGMNHERMLQKQCGPKNVNRGTYLKVHQCKFFFPFSVFIGKFRKHVGCGDGGDGGGSYGVDDGDSGGGGNGVAMVVVMTGGGGGGDNCGSGGDGGGGGSGDGVVVVLMVGQ
ncbi:uncharacterized protein LOC111882646 [Lactuca sativa]|uniref:uncharacterized protein LOC111882646 n=1 Tax=Lactuca sativa TaxID=4236 RepID=UPI000CD8B3D3|nr:uncharacterized protein LOC111882646 [Lactuca sativa]